MSNLTTGYFVFYPLLVLLLLVTFLIYLILKKFLKFFSPFGAIILSLIIPFLFTYFINEILGLYFSKFPLISTVGLFILIVINEMITSKLKKNLIKILFHVSSLLLVSIGLLFSLLYLYKGYFQPRSYPDSYDCVKNIGQPCFQIEDKGKVTAAKTKEALALMKKYGRENVSIKALDIHLAHDQNYISALNPNFEGETGCIILVRAGIEGYIMQEEKNLKVIHIETLEEFKENTKNTNPQVLDQFYNSLH